jgi:hypothetical protein
MAALLDELLCSLGGYSLDRDRRAAVGASEFMLLAAWPMLLHHYGAALLDERSAMRWRTAVSARGRRARVQLP